MPNKFFPPQTDTATRLAATPLAGEIIFDTDENALYTGDGVTPGGLPTGGTGDGGGGSVPTAWGTITGTLANQTDLNQALADAATPQSYATLTDVDTTGLQVGQAMFWNGAVWTPKIIGLNDLTDVELPAEPKLGDCIFWNGTAWVPAKGAREVLTANRTYYVRTDGSDSNDGLSDSSGGAFLTIQKAIDVVASLDISIYNVTIQVADGNYSGQGKIYPKAPLGSGTVTLQGNVSDRTLVKILSLECGSSVGRYGGFIVKNIYIDNGSTTSALLVSNSILTIDRCRIKNVVTTTAFNVKLTVAGNSILRATNGLELEGNNSGGNGNCVYVFGQSLFVGSSQTITFVNSPTFNTVFTSDALSFIELGGGTLSGSYSGTLYTKLGGGIIRQPNYAYL